VFGVTPGRLHVALHGRNAKETAMLTASSQPETAQQETPEASTLPLWLTEKEAEALLILSASSPRSGGVKEREIFGKLGDLLRAFRR
jgi:hypothetical protein